MVFPSLTAGSGKFWLLRPETIWHLHQKSRARRSPKATAGEATPAEKLSVAKTARENPLSGANRHRGGVVYRRLHRPRIMRALDQPKTRSVFAPVLRH